MIINDTALDTRVAKQFKEGGRVVLARIIAFADENGTAMLDDDVLLVVKGEGAEEDVPKELADKHAVVGETETRIRTWNVDGQDETMLAVFDTASYSKMLSPVEEDGGGAMAIRGADGRLYMVPGQSEDYRMSDDMASMVDQLPGGSIELHYMKNIPAALLGSGDCDPDSSAKGTRDTKMRTTMTRATMMRNTMLRNTMLRNTMLRNTMLRNTMLRNTMLRNTMATADHDEER